MKVHDVLRKGEVLIRILNIKDDLCLCINFSAERMPAWVPANLLEDYTPEAAPVIDTNMTASQKQVAHERFTMIAPMLAFLTDDIRAMIAMAEKQDNRIARKSLEDTIELLILVELDRAEQERLTLSKRTREGLAASPNKSGRKTGQVDKLTPELREDIIKYLHDRSIKQTALIKKHKICRNTLCKYIEIVKTEQNG